MSQQLLGVLLGEVAIWTFALYWWRKPWLENEFRWWLWALRNPPSPPIPETPSKTRFLPSAPNAAVQTALSAYARGRAKAAEAAQKPAVASAPRD